MSKSHKQIAAETKKMLTAQVKKTGAAADRAAVAYDKACEREEKAHAALQDALNRMRLAAMDVSDAHLRRALAEIEADRALENRQAFQE